MHKPTRKCYAPHQRDYTSFAAAKDLPVRSESTLSMFMRHSLENRKLGRSVIVDTIPAAVNDMFRFEQGPSPSKSEMVRQTKAIVRKRTKPSRPKLPIKVVQLKAMLAKCRRTSMDVRDMFILILMFTGFLRESEVARLGPEDVWLAREENMDVLFVYVSIMSKADKYRTGATIVISASPASALCPVKWFHTYMRVRRQDATSFFHQESKAEPLAAATPYHIVRNWLEKIGVDPKPYGSHSLRRGGTSKAAAGKVALHLLKRHGRWKSDAVFLYIVDELSERLSVTASLFS